MKKLILLTIAIPLIIFAQEGWLRWFGGGGTGECVQLTSDGGYIVTGSYEKELCLIKTDSEGETVWMKTYGGDGFDAGYYLQEINNGCHIVVGYNSTRGLWLLKTDGNGDTLWTKVYTGGAHCVQATSEGGYVIVGNILKPSKALDLLLIKTDENGDTIWTRTYGGGLNDVGHHVIETDGGYVIVGTARGLGDEPYERQIWLLKTDFNGDTLWTRLYERFFAGSTHENYNKRIIQTSDGGFMIVGKIFIGNGNTDMLLIKTDSEGNTMWTKKYGGRNLDEGNFIQETKDGGYIVTGGFYDNNDNYNVLGDQIWLVKLDSHGDTVWTKRYGGWAIYHETGNCVRQTDDGGYVIAGTNESFPPTGLCLIKTDSHGRIPAEISPYSISSPRGGTATESPKATFVNISTESYSDSFYYRCVIENLDSSTVHYQDSILVTDEINPWEYQNIEFAEVHWPLGHPANFRATFYATSALGDSLRSRPMSTDLWWNGTSITEQQPEPHQSSFEVVTAVGSNIVLRFAGASGAHGDCVAIFDATGRLVDEIHIPQTGGTITWGEGYGPGVYFIRIEGDASATTHKVILIK